MIIIMIFIVVLDHKISKKGKKKNLVSGNELGSIDGRVIV